MSIFEANSMVRRSDPDTSARAAIKAVEFKGKHEAIIFGAICDAGSRGATYREIARSICMEPVAVGRRLSAMCERNLIKRFVTGYREDGKEIFYSRGGCCVWRKA